MGDSRISLPNRTHLFRVIKHHMREQFRFGPTLGMAALDTGRRCAASPKKHGARQSSGVRSQPSSEARVHKRLSGACRRAVLFGHLMHQRELRPQGSGQRLRRVTHDRQPAAAFRTVERERTDDHRATAGHRFMHPTHVSGPPAWTREEVEYRAIVPDVYRGRDPLPCYVRLDPIDTCGVAAKPCPRAFQGGTRNIQHRHAACALLKQSVHEAGIPAPDVDDSRVRLQPCRSDQVERH